MVARGHGEGDVGSCCSMGVRFQLCKMKKFQICSTISCLEFTVRYHALNNVLRGRISCDMFLLLFKKQHPEL